MSIQDLKDHGVLLPEAEWGEHRLSTTVPQGRLLTSFALAVGSLVSIYTGGGGLWTWVGLGGFLIGLYAITGICDRAVARQRRRVEEERNRVQRATREA